MWDKADFRSGFEAAPARSGGFLLFRFRTTAVHDTLNVGIGVRVPEPEPFAARPMAGRWTLNPPIHVRVVGREPSFLGVGQW